MRLSDLPAFVTEASPAIEADQPGTLAVAFGHFGDGNVHLSVHPPEGLDRAGIDAVLYRAKNILNARIDAYRGGISAEHGIGRLKRADFDARLAAPARGLLAAIKHGLDPEGRMNPGSLHP